MTLTNKLTSSLVSNLTTSLVGEAGSAPPPVPTFRLTIKTNNSGSSASNQFALPLGSAGNYGFVVEDWGDGSSDTITAWDQAETTHTYSSEGTYNIAITGTIKGWRFNNGGDKLKIQDITENGPFQPGGLGTNMFKGCANLTWTATDPLDLVDANLTGAWQSCEDFNYDVSKAINFTGTSLLSTFRNADLFNRNIANIITSAVTNMNLTLTNTSFDQDISGGDFTGVTNIISINGTSFSTVNYGLLLNSLAGQALKNNVSLRVDSATYPASAATARAYLISNFSWTITDSGPA